MNAEAKDVFVKNLEYFMAREGVTQADIARRLKIQTSTVSYWCTGQRYPRPDAMQRLADMLQCTMAELMSKDNHADKSKRFNSDFFECAMLLNEKAYSVLLPIMQSLAQQPEYQRKSNVQK